MQLADNGCTGFMQLAGKGIVCCLVIIPSFSGNFLRHGFMHQFVLERLTKARDNGLVRSIQACLDCGGDVLCGQAVFAKQVGGRSRGAETVDAYDLAMAADPAVPVVADDSLNGHACGQLRWQHLFLIVSLLTCKQPWIRH
jgi:hypothetical protein